jgi:hypothetical protein
MFASKIVSDITPKGMQEQFVEYLAVKCTSREAAEELAYDVIAAVVQQTPCLHFLTDIVPLHKTPAEIVASMHPSPA